MAPQPAQHLLPLVESIVRRASGVFIWVKLVLRDLFRVVIANGQQVENLQDQLQKTLESLPDQLDEYFAAIIDRIAQGTRWETYVALESLARSTTIFVVA